MSTPDYTDVILSSSNPNPKPKPTQVMDPSEQNGQFDIFSNPQIQRAKEALAPEVRAQYEQIGENIWNQMEASQMAINNSEGDPVDFTGENLPPPVEESAAHISEALKSGMHPSLLEEDEANLMKECFGDTWWRNWNYTDDEMVTTSPK